MKETGIEKRPVPLICQTLIKLSKMPYREQIYEAFS